MVRCLVLLFAAGLCLAPNPAGAFPGPATPPSTNASVPREVIVRFRPQATEWQRAALREQMNGRVKWQFRRPDVQLIELASGSAEDVILQLADDPMIEYLEPNYRVQVLATPTDPRFSELWGMRNIGQTGGTPGADIRAVNAWDVFTGDPNQRVGVIDTGVDYTHPDLADNIWTNPGEIPGNSIDDDLNGFVDDVHGFDFVNFDGDPMDDHGHGTHVSGTIAAVANNGMGVAGVNWRAKIVGIKFLDAGGFGSTAAAIASIEYSMAIGLKITNNSWGGGPFSEALFDAITAAGTAGQIFVAAAGNGFGNDNDLNPTYPATYSAGNIISVAATDHDDQLAAFSNIGATTVDLAAPGQSILSTVPSGGYLVASGTSMAAPHVSGAVALLWGYRPALSAAQVRARVLAGVDPRPALAGKMVTGGRLNALFTVSDPDSIPPGAIGTLNVVGVSSNTVLLSWSATGDDGATGRASSYDIRYSTAPITDSNFESATPFPGPDPRPASAADSVEVRGLPFSTTHYFALRAFDEYSNPGPISNVVSATTLGAPEISVSPTSISSTLAGTSEVRTLTLSNLGAGTLDFTIPTPVVALAPMPQQPTVTVAKGAIDPRRGVPVVVDQGGPDSFGYRWVDSDDPGGPAFDWADITATGTLTSLSGDEEVLSGVPIGFPFSFYGNDFETVNLGANGWLSFTDSRIPTFNIQPLPNSGPMTPANLVAPFWSDLHTGGTRRVYVHNDGERFVVSWVGMSHYFLPGTYTFQAILHRNGELRFQYHTLSGPDSFSSIGIQNGSRDVGLNISFLTDYARPGLAVRVLPPASWLTANPRSGRIAAGSSQVVNLTLDATRLLGGTYRADLQVDNNDPDESHLVVPVQLVAIGVPEIELSPTAIDFGSVLTGGTARETVFVQNPGTDSLRVTSISSSHPAFVPAFTSLVVPPLAQRPLRIDFVPLANGPFTGTLTLNSNDADEGVRTVALAGVALPPPDIAVAPESLFVGLLVNQAISRTVRVSNPGESDLDVVVIPLEVPGESGAGPGPGTPSRLPVDPSPGGPPPVPPGPEVNLLPRTQPPVAMAGFYSGSRMNFGVSDFGEVMPFQFPNGAEHLATGAWISGYTVAFKTADSLIWTSTAGHDFRNNVVPESFQELENSPSRVRVRVTTRTGDGSIRIVRDITFLRDDQFVHVSTRLDNLTGGTLAGVVFKEFADWDVNGDPGDDTWDFDTDRDMVLASDQQYTGLVAGTTPLITDLYGWDDFASYTTVVNFPSGPVVQLDGLALLHFDVGNLSGGESATQSASYCAGGDLDDLRAVADRSSAGVRWLTASPDTFRVSPGAFVDVTVGFDADGLFGGDYRAVLRLMSNDPNEGQLDVPVLMRVIGVPDFTVFPSALTFDDTFIGFASVETLVVSNVGTDSLRVSNIVSSSSVYDVSPLAFVLGPLGSRPVVVTFAPTGTGLAGGILDFISNDPLEPAFEVPVEGVGLVPPIAGAQPDSFVVGLFTGGVHHRQLSISNSGGSNLVATIQAVAVGSPDSSSPARPAAFTLSNPRPGIRLDDWQAQAGTPRPAMLGVPAPRAFPTASLPQVILDPVGDAIGVDLERLRGASSGGELKIAFELATPLLPSSFGGYLSLDTDQNPATGEPPVFGAPGHDIGQDYLVTLFALSAGVVELYQTPGFYLGAFPVQVGPSGFSFAIPLSVFGDDGRMDVSGVIGNSIGPTDWFPDAGHGTIAGASWLSFTPSEVTVPPGSTVLVDAQFDAAGLNGGEYRADITISSNDPGPGNTLIVPALLNVTGAPDIALSPLLLNFGDLFLGQSSAESLIVSNEGTDLLEISSITSSDPAFAVSASSLSLAPGTSQVVMVSFTPASPIHYLEAIALHSNDLDEPEVRLDVQGQGLVPPVIGVAPESLLVGLLTNETKTRTVRVSNTGGSPLHVTVAAGSSPPDSLTSASSAGPGPVSMEFASFDPRRETPGIEPPPGGGSAPRGIGPEINRIPRTVAPRVLMGNYSGVHLAFGITDLGEIMPFQFPVGNEHLALGGWVSGYTAAYLIDGFARVFWSGHDTRFGITPISYQELVNSPTLVSVRVTTATIDGVMRIVREFEFPRHERFVRVTTRFENTSGGSVEGVVYKEFADWDMDGDFTDDSWDYDFGRGLTISSDVEFAGLAGSRIPDKMDMFGWQDHNNYDTFVDFPVGPVHNLDGTTLLHFDQGALPVGGSVSAGVAYCAGNDLAELQAAVDLANTKFLEVTPVQFTVAPGGFTDLAVQFDATGLSGGSYSADIRISSNDPLRNVVQVPVLLQVTGVPDLRIAPEAIDFGSVFVGVAATETLEVQNVGSDVLVVSGITLSDPVFSVGESGFTLAPGARRSVNVHFQPGSPGLYSGTVQFHSNDPDHPVSSVSLAGSGQLAPDVAVDPGSLHVTLVLGQSSQHAVAVANTGGSDLLASIVVADPAPDTTGPLRVFPPDGSANGVLLTPGPETNNGGVGGPVRTLAGAYSGTKIAFGISDLGEIITFQFPHGVEHLWVSTRLSGYNIGFLAGSTPIVYLAGTDARFGIEPVSYQELSLTPSLVSVRVVTRTYDGILRITRDFTFRRTDQFVHVATTIENLTGAPIEGLVFKEFADWDVDAGTVGDLWTKDTALGLVYAYDNRYVALATKDAPALMDVYGWGDYFSYDTVVETMPIDPTPIDGLALLHYSLETLAPKSKVTRSASYCAAITRFELLQVAQRAGSGPAWIDATPTNMTVGPGQSQDLTVRLDSQDLEPGEHHAIVRIASNDPDEPNVEVPVRLTVVILPDIAGDPLDFGPVYVSQERVASVELRNEGSVPLVISGMTTTGAFAAVGATTGTIAPEETMSVPVRFAPTGGCSPCNGTLVVSSNDPDENPFVVPLTGIGVVPPQVTFGPTAVEAHLAPALGPPATTTSKTLTLGNPGGSALTGRAIPVEVSLPEGARVIAAGPIAAAESETETPRLDVGGPDAAGYTWSASNEPGGPVFEWVEIAVPTNRLALTGNDNVVQNVPIGFGFPFYGNSFSTVNVSTNGWLSFTSALLPGSTPVSLPSTSASAPRNLVAPFWENLTFGTLNRAYALREPDRFIVTYSSVSTLPLTGTYTFQTILHADGRIVFQYNNVPMPPPSLGTVGIQNGDGTIGLTVSSGAPFIERNLAVEFIPGVGWLKVVPGVFEVQAGGTLPLGVQFDATGLADGDHQALIRLLTNDLETPVVDIPVSLHIGSIVAGFKVNLSCSRDHNGYDQLGGDDDDDDGGGGDDDDDDGGGHDDDDDGGQHDDDDDGGHDDEDDGPAPYVRGVITLPSGYDPHDVVISSIRAAGTVPISSHKTPRIHEQKLKVWFNRAALLAVLPDGDAVTVAVAGEIEGVTWFGGTATACVHRPSMAAIAAQYHAGAPVALHWSNPPGMEANGFDLWFSYDAGETWTPIARAQTSHSITWSVPNIGTTEGILGLVAFGPDGPTGSFISTKFEIVGATADRLSLRGMPSAFGLRLAGPNPSRHGPILELALPARQTVAVAVYDIQGARVRSYPAAEFEAGWHRVTWDGRGDDGRPLGPGVYFVRGTAGRERATVRVAMLK